MGDIDGEEPSNSKARDEKIFVSVRLRPLNAKENSRYDVSDWECVNENTIIYKSSIGLPERSQFPSAYTFGKKLLSISFGIMFSRLIYEKKFPTASHFDCISLLASLENRGSLGSAILLLMVL